MKLELVDVSRCQRKEKEIVEGLCLSYDLIRGVCLETMQACDGDREGPEDLQN